MWLLLFQDRGAAFLASLVTGVFIGLIYDVFRIGRVVYRGGRIKLFFDDLLFFIMAALVFTVFMFNATMGVIRLFTAVGALFGFFAYRFSIGLGTARVASAIKAFLTPHVKRAISIAKAKRSAFCDKLFTKAQSQRILRFARRGFA